MKLSQEMLMAYADGELDAETRHAIETAMATDPEIAEQVERHHNLRSQLGAAFDGMLHEPVPDRLLDAARSSPAGSAGKIVNLAEQRAAQAQSATGRRWAWREWTAIAASLLIGVLAGRAALQPSASDLLATRGGRIVASGALDAALSERPGGSPANNSGIDIGLSFRSKGGEYCRTFNARQDRALAGFACRESDRWRVHALVQADPKTSGGDYRMAGTQLPQPILQAVEQVIAGDALDAEEESAARERGWRP